jgi:fibronectin type 3 domain-containing protein
MLGLTNDLIQSLFSGLAPENNSGSRIPRLFFALAVASLTLTSCQKAAPHSVTLTWNVSTDPKASIVGYNVYRRTLPDGQFVKLADRVAKPPYEDRLVLTGREYVYAVTALDQSGHESHFSIEARAKIP